jgi:hypothetical protein
MSLFRKNKDQVLAVISNGNKLIVIVADCRSESPETQLCDTIDDDGNSKASLIKRITPGLINCYNKQ